MILRRSMEGPVIQRGAACSKPACYFDLISTACEIQGEGRWRPPSEERFLSTHPPIDRTFWQHLSCLHGFDPKRAMSPHAMKNILKTAKEGDAAQVVRLDRFHPAIPEMWSRLSPPLQHGFSSPYYTGHHVPPPSVLLFLADKGHFSGALCSAGVVAGAGFSNPSAAFLSGERSRKEAESSRRARTKSRPPVRPSVRCCCDGRLRTRTAISPGCARSRLRSSTSYPARRQELAEFTRVSASKWDASARPWPCGSPPQSRPRGSEQRNVFS